MALYCDANSLEVNKDKTKILIFHRGRLQGKFNTFYYKNNELEIVNNFQYLGTSCSGSFNSAPKVIKKNVDGAMSALMSTLYGSKLEAWKAQEILINSLVCSVLLHGIEVSGIRH